MLLTITQDGRVSTTGTFPNEGADPSDLINTTPAPIPEVPYSDPYLGKLGARLYACAESLRTGDIVMAQVTQATDTEPQRFVRRADAQDAGPVLGVVTAKARATVAEVVHVGVAPVFAGLTPGQRYYLGADGALAELPLEQASPLYVHFVGYAVASDTLMVQPSYPLLKRGL